MERRESFQERRKRQQARRRLLGKLAAVLIGAVFLFGLCKKTADQFLLTGEKKQDSYIGIEDAGHMVWLLADCRQEQPTQALAETTDAAQEFDGDNTQAAVVSAHAAGSRSTPDQVLDLMKKFQAESDDGYLTWTQAKQYFPSGRGGGSYFYAVGLRGRRGWREGPGTAGSPGEKESMMLPEGFGRRRS